MQEILENKDYENLINSIDKVYTKAKNKVSTFINQEILKTYWFIGKNIVEFEQKGKLKAEYGKQLILKLSKDLTLKHGKGFSRSNLQNMRLFYQYYPIYQTVSGKLSWSHYIELISIKDELSRKFYEKQTELENWSVRELKRQKKTGLFHRLALSKNKQEILNLSKKGQIVETENDLIKNPFVFEFLNLPEKNLYTENDLEEAIISNLQDFLLELGKGFAFIGRQQRITINNRHYFVDLVFYHFKLKCFVLIDLKIGKVLHESIGQMKLYLGYYEKEINEDTDNQPIGLILSHEKNDIMIEYAMLNDNSKLIVSEYQLYLPKIEDLKTKILEIIEK